MFERVRYGRRDPEAALRGCAAAVLLIVGACTWLVGAIAMFGVSWLLVLLRALLAWLLADPTWILPDELEVTEVRSVNVGPELEPLLYDPTDALAELALEPPPPLPAPDPARMELSFAIPLLAALEGPYEDWGVVEAGVVGEDFGVSHRISAVGDEEAMLRGSSARLMGVLGAADGASIGSLMGAEGDTFGSGGFGVVGTAGHGGGLVGSGGGLGTLGTGSGVRVVKRVAPAWGERAAEFVGTTCRVGLKVREGAFDRVEDWGGCPKPLRGAIEDALRAGRFVGTGATSITYRIAEAP